MTQNQIYLKRFANINILRLTFAEPSTTYLCSNLFLKSLFNKINFLISSQALSIPENPVLGITFLYENQKLSSQISVPVKNIFQFFGLIQNDHLLFNPLSPDGLSHQITFILILINKNLLQHKV